MTKDEIVDLFRLLRKLRESYNPGPGWDTLVEAERLTRIEGRELFGDAWVEDALA